MNHPIEGKIIVNALLGDDMQRHFHMLMLSRHMSLFDVAAQQQIYCAWLVAEEMYLDDWYYDVLLDRLRDSAERMMGR